MKTIIENLKKDNMSAKDHQIKFLQYRVEALEKELKKQKEEIIICNNIIYNEIDKPKKR